MESGAKFTVRFEPIRKPDRCTSCGSAGKTGIAVVKLVKEYDEREPRGKTYLGGAYSYPPRKTMAWWLCGKHAALFAVKYDLAMPREVMDMPMPTPHKEEDKKVFLNRCMGDSMMVDEFPDENQRYAVCLKNWQTNMKSDITGDERDKTG